MILLDTNVVSEVLRHETDANVARWFSMQSPTSLAITVVTSFELRFGLQLMAPSRRRADFVALVDEFIASLASGAVVPLDAQAADHAAAFRAKRRMLGHPVSVADAPIAGIALRRGAVLATRNVRDFADSGLELLDPWQMVSP